MIGEKERIEKYFAEKQEFTFEDHNNRIELIDTIKLKKVKCDFDQRKFRKLKCYLYHFDRLGINEGNIVDEFEGKKLLIYKSREKNKIRRSKCPWCYMPIGHEKLENHILTGHNKTISDIKLLDFQKNLYREMLRIVRETEYYFGSMFINAGCRMCDNPITEGRELCCSIPTSFRDRARSLSIMGVSSRRLPEEYLLDESIGQILLAP
jgi:hypothetical protein